MGTHDKKIREINIYMQPESAPIDRVRVGCRGILVRDDKVLLSFEKMRNYCFLPGGGLEEGETIEEGCVREIVEETGVKVSVISHLVTVNCIYNGVNFRNHFFVCEYEGQAKQHLTAEEEKNKLIPYYMKFEDALDFFGRYEAYKEVDPPLFGCYHRDFEVLKIYQKEYR